MLNKKNALSYAAALIFFGSCSSVALAVDPTDNPIDAAYGSTYSWSDNIKWNNVFNITNYGGVGDGSTDNTTAINSAISAASTAGGGVVYLPAGTYNFSQSIQLQNGVVIRGATPSGVTNATQSGYAPPTQMVFPKFNYQDTTHAGNVSGAFKTITSANPYTDSNIGIVNVDVNRAEIAFGVTAASLTTSGGGTPSLAARNDNIVVYGVRSNNVALADPSSGVTAGGAGQVYDYRFAANIMVQPFANALIGNNRLNDIQSGAAGSDSFVEPGYKINANAAALPGTLAGGAAIFDYNGHYGIVAGRQTGSLNSAGNNIPSVDPFENRPGISIVGNYVNNSDRVKIQAGGYQAVVSNNVLVDSNSTPFLDASNKRSWVDSTGTKLTSGSTTLEQRGIDITGWSDTVSNNNITVYKSIVGNTSGVTNDGEGILDQASSGTIVNGMNISNNTINSNISIYKTGEIRNLTINANTLVSSAGPTNVPQIFVESDTNAPGTVFPAYNTSITNNTVASQGIYFQAGSYTNGTDGNVITGNTGNGNVSYKSPNASVSNNGTLGTSSLGSAVQVDMGPSISITSPTFFQTINGSAVNITAAVSDPSSPITNVVFYDETTNLGSGVNNGDGTWSFNYTGLAVNQYMVSAVATAADGLTYSSAPEYFTIVAAVPEPASLGVLAIGGLMVLRRPRRR